MNFEFFAVSLDRNFKSMSKQRKTRSHEFTLTYGEMEGGDYRDTWQVFRIMAEFVSGYQFLSSFNRVITVFGSARIKKESRYYQDAEQLGRMLAHKKYTTITGGGPGIMEAANKGACTNGGGSVGLNIHLPFEQRINPYVKKSIAFHYFFSRKVMLSSPAQAFVFYPGGFGTLDELFEVLDNMELGLIDTAPVILVGKEFWEPLLDFLEHNSIERLHCAHRMNISMIRLVDRAEEAFSFIKNTKRLKRDKCTHLSVHNFYCDAEINWRIFRIMSEIVEGFEFLTTMKRDITILGTKSIKPESPYYLEAYKLGRGLALKKYTVVTGGGSGVMEAANKGARDVGGESIGLYTHSIDQGKVNNFLTRSLSFDFSFTRKLILTSPSKAFVLFPGGIGTMDQVFEVLTLIQTGKMKGVPVVLFGSEYWQPLLDFLRYNVFEEKHAISRHDLTLFDVADTAEDVMKIFKRKRV